MNHSAAPHVDFAVMGSRVLLIEVNPFDGVLGSFKASTGLFDWEKDRNLMSGFETFETRVQHTKSTRASCAHHMRSDWFNALFHTHRIADDKRK